MHFHCWTISSNGVISKQLILWTALMFWMNCYLKWPMKSQAVRCWVEGKVYSNRANQANRRSNSYTNNSWNAWNSGHCAILKASKSQANLLRWKVCMTNLEASCSYNSLSTAIWRRISLYSISRLPETDFETFWYFRGFRKLIPSRCHLSIPNLLKYQTKKRYLAPINTYCNRSRMFKKC